MYMCISDRLNTHSHVSSRQQSSQIDSKHLRIYKFVWVLCYKKLSIYTKLYESSLKVIFKSFKVVWAKLYLSILNGLDI